MSAIASTRIDTDPKNGPTSGRLFFLDSSEAIGSGERIFEPKRLARQHGFEPRFTA